MNTVTIKYLRERYGENALLVLTNTSFVSLSKERKYRGWRRYKILKELPDVACYERLERSYFTVGLIVLYQTYLGELNCLIREISNQLANTQYHLWESSSHTFAAFDSLGIIRNCVNELEKHNLDNIVSDKMRKLEVVFKPTNYYGKRTPNKSVSRNDTIYDCVQAFGMVRGFLQVLGYSEDKEVKDFCDSLFSCENALDSVRFTAWKTK